MQSSYLNIIKLNTDESTVKLPAFDGVLSALENAVIHKYFYDHPEWPSVIRSQHRVVSGPGGLLLPQTTSTADTSRK